MTRATLISVGDYLSTGYDPDRDYLDGEVKERHLGERPHSLFQMLFTMIFYTNRHRWNVVPLPEQRVQVSSTRFRIPDVCVVRRSDPTDPIVHAAPLLCVEILSRDDALGDMQDRVNDYVQMGVEHVWIVDPVRRLAWTGSALGFAHPLDGVLRIPGTSIEVVLQALFQEADELEAGGGNA